MTARPRNIVWITSDHLRFDCIGAHGNLAMHTPNLDALVNGGVTFTRCYANNPICMPSRCSFMTGCYPQQTGVMNNGQELPDTFEPVAARCFSSGGYRTVQIGKLHLQAHEDHDLDPRPRNTYGFDVMNLSEEPGCYEDAYRIWLRGEHPDLVPIFTVPRPMSTARHRETRQFDVLSAPWQASHSGWVATQACRYLGAWGSRPEPQFMHLGFYAPHPPLNPTTEMFAPYRDLDIPPPSRSALDWNDPQNTNARVLNDYRRHFFAMVTGVDFAVGKVVNELKRLDLFDDTLLIVNADHGDACGDHGQTGKGPTFYESIMRVPWILHWPNGLGAEGRRVDSLVELIDVLPTMLDLVGLPTPRAMAGRSYGAALEAEREVDGRADVYAVHDAGHLMLRTEDVKYIRYVEEGGSSDVLYDLAEDPGEFTNRADDPAYAERRAAMRDRALARTLEASRSIRERRLTF